MSLEMFIPARNMDFYMTQMSYYYVLNMFITIKQNYYVH